MIILRKFTVLLLVLVITGHIFSSCHTSDKSSDDGFEFSIQGVATNGENLELALYLPSTDLDERIKSKIQDGRYQFSGVAKQVEMAEIRFEENIVSGSSMYSSTPIVIEPGLTDFDFNVSGEPMMYFLDDCRVRKGELNTFFYDVGPKLQEAANTWVFSDSVMNDSMVRFVYPNVRASVYEIYDSVCGLTNPNPVCLFFLKRIIEDFESGGVFAKNHLTSVDLETFRSYLITMDKDDKERNEYRFIQTSLDNAATNNTITKFVDYSLRNEGNEEVLLSDICKKNQFTIIDFWWSGCVPCRKFNRDNVDNYDELRSNGIELIGINVDESRSKWLESSKEDNILWQNLYAGAATDIQAAYQVDAFPKKLVYDSEMNYVDLKFKDIDDFLTKMKLNK